MRRILMFICAGTLCCFCGKEEPSEQPECPVKEIVMPASDASNPIIPASSVTIEGKGFVPDCEIWLHSTTRSEVQAEITDITATALVFTAPAVYGEQLVILRQDSGTFELGKLVFATDPEDKPVALLPHRISYIHITYPNNKTFNRRFAYNTLGQITSITNTDYQYSYGSGPATRTTTYTYSQNQITSVDATYPQRPIFETFDLENGRTVKYTLTNQGSSYTSYYTLSYDAGGYIAGYGWTNNDDDWASNAVYSIIDGSPNQIQARYSPQEGTYQLVTVQFTNNPAQLNNLNIDLFGLEEFTDGELTDPVFLVGCGGKRFRTLPTRCTYMADAKDAAGNNVADTNEEIATYQYEMDGDYISRIRISIGGKLDSEMEFFYEE